VFFSEQKLYDSKTTLDKHFEEGDKGDEEIRPHVRCDLCRTAVFGM
jgi:hypothetical protein